MVKLAALRERLPVAQTIGYYLSFVAFGLTAASLGPTLDGLADQTGTSLSQISFLFVVRPLGYLLGIVLASRLFDRVAGNPVLLVSLGVMIAALVTTGSTPVLWLMGVVFIALGSTEGLIDVGGNTLLIWTFRKRAGPFISGLHFCFGVGALLSPIIIAQAVLITDHVAWAYRALALLVIPAALWLWRLPSPTAEPAKHGAKITASIPYRLVFLIALLLFLYAGAEVAFSSWIFNYSTELDLAGETEAAYLTSIFWGALTIGRLLAVPLAMRYTPGAILLVDLAGCLVFMGLMLAWVAAPAVWIGTFGIGLAMASVFPAALALAERNMRITGHVNSFFFGGAGFGGMLLPWLIGQLFETRGPRIMLWAVLGDLLAMGLVFALTILYIKLVVKRNAENHALA